MNSNFLNLSIAHHAYEYNFLAHLETVFNGGQKAPTWGLLQLCLWRFPFRWSFFELSIFYFGWLFFHRPARALGGGGGFISSFRHCFPYFRHFGRKLLSCFFDGFAIGAVFYSFEGYDFGFYFRL